MVYNDEWMNGEKESFSIVNQILDTFINTKKAYKEGILDIDEIIVICRTLKTELKDIPSRYIYDAAKQIVDMINDFVKKEKAKEQDGIATE